MYIPFLLCAWLFTYNIAAQRDQPQNFFSSTPFSNDLFFVKKKQKKGLDVTRCNAVENQQISKNVSNMQDGEPKSMPRGKKKEER